MAIGDVIVDELFLRIDNSTSSPHLATKLRRMLTPTCHSKASASSIKPKQLLRKYVQEFSPALIFSPSLHEMQSASLVDRSGRFPSAVEMGWFPRTLKQSPFFPVTRPVTRV
ncbi:hypothetical protein R1flu_014884 [Riccia fluitans]|uniref:Uncharacterized protein n=1 Tax=Riccia fluitans TaxID=41844 RepID=A0ABD1YHC9_9MARC